MNVHASPEADSDVGQTDRVYVASKLYASIDRYFAHWSSVPELNLEKAYRKYLDTALNAPNRQTFSLATLAFVAQLSNGHSNFYDYWLFEKYGQPLGFQAVWLEDQWVVLYSDLRDLKPGDVILSLNGQNPEEFFQKQKAYVSASSIRSQRSNLFSDFYSFLFPQRFVLRLVGGKEVVVDRTTTPKPQELFLKEQMFSNGQVGYLKIPSFKNTEFEKQGLNFLQRHSDLRTLIVDVRGNDGGTTPQDLIKSLMDRPYRSWSESTPLQIGLFSYYGELYQRTLEDQSISDMDRGYIKNSADYFHHSQLLTPSSYEAPKAPFFKGNILILIDAGCYSACEDFVIPFKDNHRAVLIGETTGGSTGQPYFYRFENNMAFRISTKREYMPDGSQFEGVGVAPNISIPLTVQDLKLGFDRVLKKALELAEEDDLNHKVFGR